MFFPNFVLSLFYLFNKSYHYLTFMKSPDKVIINFYEYFFFLNQQFITWCTVADRDSYFVTMYKRSRLHERMEIEIRKRSKKLKIEN